MRPLCSRFCSSQGRQPFILLYRWRIEFFRRVLLSLFCLIHSPLVPALSVFGDWNTLFISGQFSKGQPWLYFMEFSERNSQNASKSSFGLAQLSTYNGLGYRFNPNHQVFLGFAYQYTQPPYANRIVQELDTLQQYEYLDQLKDGRYAIRTRLEERNDIVQASANGPSLRFRNRLKFAYPIGTYWEGIVSNEIFFNLNQVNWGPSQGFSQNRFFIGLGYQFSRAMRTELGYMNQYVKRNLDEPFMGNQISLNLFLNPSEW